jgi:phosphoenolpyruvate carboxykinase (ATP)
MKSNKIIINPTVPELYKLGINIDKLELSSTGALLAYSGEKTGRSPKDKRMVYDENTKDIWWGPVNKKIDGQLYDYYKKSAIEYLDNQDRIYQIDAYAGWDSKYQLKVRVLCTSVYHALFMKNMLIASEPFEDDNVDFTIINVGELNLSKLNPPIDIKDNSLNDTLVALNMTDNSMIIYGTRYAGEMKKGILTLMMYLMPRLNELTLHSSANVGKNMDDLCLFFGLSGTGKTTLSADSSRYLIGDDEHVWHTTGIFNVEGGCYAKCIGLRKEFEPEIFDAIRFGSVVENVVYNKNGEIDYNDSSITQNTRCAYPLEFIPNVLIPAKTDLHPTNIIFLTCDAFGVLPPVCKLTVDQAVYFFVNGYTSKIPGTEIGITQPVSTFSSCFGEPFLVWHPLRYGELLKEKILKFKPTVWMLNTGWIKGEFGVGHRISINDTRTLLNNILDGSLIKQNFEIFPYFEVEIPTSCPNIDSQILNPQNVWNNKEQYLASLNDLYNKFKINYQTKIEAK